MKMTLFKTKYRAMAVCCAIFALPVASPAQTSYTISDSTAAAFMANGPTGNLATNNYGNSGTLAIAPASSTKGAFDSLLLFNTTAAASQFNTDYGAGNWTITDVQLSLASNFGVQGVQPGNQMFNTINAGNFGIDWLVDNSWTAGNGGGRGTPGYPVNNDVDYAYVPTLLSFGYDSLGDFAYVPPGNNVYLTYTMPTDAGLDTAAVDGAVSLFFYAANNQVSYLFNSQAFGSNYPNLILTATPTPEPGTFTMFGTGFVGFFMVRRRKATS